MKPPSPTSPFTEDLFRHRLDTIINMSHPLVKLGKLIDWEGLSNHFGQFYQDKGRPGIPLRLIGGLHILKHMYGLSDEGVCERWVHDPYFQYFCGEAYFCHDFPIERSSMTHWRQRVGDKSLEKLLQESLYVAYQAGALRGKDLERVAVDTTVQPKAITFPTDAKLCYKALIHLGKLAKAHGIQLRQSYPRVAKRALIMHGRYRHAKQMKRARKSLKQVKNYLGRVIRDIERKASQDLLSQEPISTALMKAKTILTQKRRDKEKIYSWHAAEVECIGKGKAHKPYEFGCKVSLVTNVNPAPGGHFVLHSKALHGRPYDGHTLNQAIEGVKSLSGVEARRIYVDKGYRGHDYPRQGRVFKSGQKRGITPTIKRELKRRSVIEPVIGHMKEQGRHLGRNYLLGQVGDKMNALFSAIGYNFRLILNYFKRILFALIQRVKNWVNIQWIISVSFS